MRDSIFKIGAISMAIAIAAAFLLPASTVSAAAAETSEPTVRQIVDQQTDLRNQALAKKGAFKDLTDSEREELIKKQNHILQLLDGRDDVQQLRVEEKIELFNDLEWVSATVRKAEEDRQICERSRTVGSNRYQTVCMTARQYREHKERARQSLRTTVKCNGGCGSD